MFGAFRVPAQGSAPGPSNAPQPATLPNQPQEPPLLAVTSDLPEFGGSPSPHPDEHAAAESGPTPHSALSTPSRSRLEVVLKASPRPPPGHQSWQEADLNNEDELSTSAAHQPSPPKKRKPGRPFGSKSHQHTSTETPAHPQQPAATATPNPGTEKRRRGRPKGWRPGMPSLKTGKPTASASRYVDEHGNPIPRAAKSTAEAGAPKRRGRPPRAPPATARKVWETMAAPTYVPFLCEWTGCKAQLQNVDTLRRHVHKLHGTAGPDGAAVCRWGKCGRIGVGEEGKFATAEELRAHVEERHFVPLVWFVGDGVRNATSLPRSAAQEEEKIPAYLLGPDGKQVTPWVKHQKEEDHAARMKNRNRLRDIIMQRDANAPLQEEDEGGEEAGRRESSTAPCGG